MTHGLSASMGEPKMLSSLFQLSDFVLHNGFFFKRGNPIYCFCLKPFNHLSHTSFDISLLFIFFVFCLLPPSPPK